MQPTEYVNAIMAGLGVIFQFGRSSGMTLGYAIRALLVIAVIVTLAVSDPLRQIALAWPGSFDLWQRFVLEGLLQFVGMISSALGGLYGTSGAAHAAVAAGANPEHPLVPVTPTPTTP